MGIPTRNVVARKGYVPPARTEARTQEFDCTAIAALYDAQPVTPPPHAELETEIEIATTPEQPLQAARSLAHTLRRDAPAATPQMSAADAGAVAAEPVIEPPAPPPQRTWWWVAGGAVTTSSLALVLAILA